jgi:hypothetical protein
MEDQLEFYKARVEALTTELSFRTQLLDNLSKELEEITNQLINARNEIR